MDLSANIQRFKYFIHRMENDDEEEKSWLNFLLLLVSSNSFFSIRNYCNSCSNSLPPKNQLQKSLILFHFVQKWKSFLNSVGPHSEPLSCVHECMCPSCACGCVRVWVRVCGCVCEWVHSRVHAFMEFLTGFELFKPCHWFFLKSRKRIVLDKSWADVVRSLSLRLQLLHKSRQQNTWKTSKNFQLKNVIRQTFAAAAAAADGQKYDRNSN